MYLCLCDEIRCHSGRHKQASPVSVTGNHAPAAGSFDIPYTLQTLPPPPRLSPQAQQELDLLAPALAWCACDPARMLALGCPAHTAAQGVKNCVTSVPGSLHALHSDGEVLTCFLSSPRGLWALYISSPGIPPNLLCYLCDLWCHALPPRHPHAVMQQAPPCYHACN